MTRLTFLNTFRGRLLIVLAFLLVATLGIQYFLNYQAERDNAKRRERQEKTLVAGITLGVNSIVSNDSLNVFKEKQQYFKEYGESIEDVLIIDDEWQIFDSFSEEYLPVRDRDDNRTYKKLRDLKDLPPLLDAESLGEDRSKFPNAASDDADDDGKGEAHAIPFETTEGRWYVMVILKSEKGAAVARAAQTLVYTLIVLLASTLLTMYLVWRFSRPIANLSEAARLVAEGDLTVRVPHAGRSDEMGRLALRFNEMTAQLEKTRDLAEQLQQAEKSAVVGRLGSAIAHEIRNPLNYINLTLDHLRAKFAPDENGKRETFEKLISQLKTEVARINQQVTDFLRYSRPITLTLRAVDLRGLIEDSIRLIEAQAHEQNIQISIVERETIPQAAGDPEYLRSVFSNLFLNAIQAMNTGGNLTVTLSTEARAQTDLLNPLGRNFVSIKIQDTGGGIAPENIDKIFEPYFSTKETGTGLGLAIVKKIVDDHNGTIAVASKLNEGTTFTVKLAKA